MPTEYMPDIEFSRCIAIIYVRSLSYIPNNGNAIFEFHPPKSKAGKRNIPMTKLVKETLLEQKAWRENVNIHHEPKAGFEDLVFTSKTNHPLHAANMKDSINYLVKKSIMKSLA